MLDKLANISKIKGFMQILEFYETTNDYIKYNDFLEDLENFYSENYIE